MKDKKEYFKELGEFLKELRKKRQLSYREAGEKIGISYGYLSSIETSLGKKSFGGLPKKETLKKIVDTYELDEEEKDKFYRLYINALLFYSLDDELVREIKKKYKIED